MRLRLRVRTTARSIPWEHVLKPGRSLVYDALARSAPELGARLHTSGWGSTGMVPFGYGPPVFPQARRRKGVYAAGGTGTVEIASPVPEVLEAIAKGLADQHVLDWGGTALKLEAIEPVDPPGFPEGRARMRTTAPVVVKGSGLDDAGNRSTRHAWVLPAEPEFDVYFEGNLNRKAATLGLEAAAQVEAITWVGPKRSFAVGGGLIPGAAVEAELRGDPQVLQAVWSWGLGQSNSAGFGQVAA